MDNKMINIKYVFCLFMVLGASACTTVISESVTDEGVIEGNVVFPSLDDATFPDGVFPNSEDLNNVANGATKKHLYKLLGRPHFKEGNGAREWDYILKFREKDDTVKTCQHKVVFDKKKVARSFYWKPRDCKPSVITVTENEVKPVKAKPSNNVRFAMPMNILFYFNKSGIDYLKPEGKEQLTVFAQRVLEQGEPVDIDVLGYTDRIGVEAYNQRLSQKRADTVKRYLMALGLPEESITARGLGASESQVECEKRMPKDKLNRCLAPDRRVTITIKQ